MKTDGVRAGTDFSGKGRRVDIFGFARHMVSVTTHSRPEESSREQQAAQLGFQGGVHPRSRQGRVWPSLRGAGEFGALRDLAAR